jgi:hypothetical protein
MALGTAVTTWQAIRAGQANAAARAREAEIRAVLEFVEQRVFAAARPKGQAGGLGREVTLRQALDAALPAVAQGFADQPLIEARLRRTLGQSYLYLGEPRTAAEHFEAARALDARHRGPDDRETLRSMFGLANSYHDWASRGRRRSCTRRPVSWRRGTAARTTPTRSGACSAWPTATRPSAGVTRPSSSARRRWRCARPGWAATTPTYSRA